MQTYCAFIFDQTARVETLGWHGPHFLIPIQKYLDDEYHTPEKQKENTRRVIVVVRSGQMILYDAEGRRVANPGPVQLPYCTVLRITSEVVEVRQRSITLLHDAYTPDNVKIASMWTTIVAMDALAGRAVPLPPALIEMTTQLIPENLVGTYEQARFPDIVSKSSGFSVEFESRSDAFRVGVTDTDPLGHVNQSVYADWYEDHHHAICNGTKSVDSADPIPVPDKYLQVVKDNLFHSGRVVRIEYMQETLPAEWIIIRLRWIYFQNAFYALWFDAITPSDIVKNQMILIFGKPNVSAKL